MVSAGYRRPQDCERTHHACPICGSAACFQLQQDLASTGQLSPTILDNRITHHHREQRSDSPLLDLQMRMRNSALHDAQPECRIALQHATPASQERAKNHANQLFVRSSIGVGDRNMQQHDDGSAYLNSLDSEQETQQMDKQVRMPNAEEFERKLIHKEQQRQLQLRNQIIARRQEQQRQRAASAQQQAGQRLFALHKSERATQQQPQVEVQSRDYPQLSPAEIKRQQDAYAKMHARQLPQPIVMSRVTQTANEAPEDEDSGLNLTMLPDKYHPEEDLNANHSLTYTLDTTPYVPSPSDDATDPSSSTGDSTAPVALPASTPFHECFIPALPLLLPGEKSSFQLILYMHSRQNRVALELWETTPEEKAQFEFNSASAIATSRAQQQQDRFAMTKSLFNRDEFQQAEEDEADETGDSSDLNPRHSQSAGEQRGTSSSARTESVDSSLASPSYAEQVVESQSGAPQPSDYLGEQSEFDDQLLVPVQPRRVGLGIKKFIPSQRVLASGKPASPLDYQGLDVKFLIKEKLLLAGDIYKMTIQTATHQDEYFVRAGRGKEVKHHANGDVYHILPLLQTGHQTMTQKQPQNQQQPQESVQLQ